MRRRNLRWTALAGAVLVGITQLAVLLGGATPASAAVSGVNQYFAHTAMSSYSIKTARAFCPWGHKILGGGGAVEHQGGTTSTQPEKVFLTELRPVHDPSGWTYYDVTGEAVPGYNGNWRIGAYATCAPASSVPSNYQIRSTVTTYDSESVKVANVGCPGSTRVIGSGAQIEGGDRQVTLQVARPSGPGDITRSQAREDANGYSGSWRLVGYAVCANPPSGYEVVFGASSRAHSETDKSALAYCPEGKRMLDAGGAITDWAPAGTALRRVLATANHRDEYAYVTASETTPTSQNWDFIVATAVCVYP